MIRFGIEFLAAETAERLAGMIRLSEKSGIDYAWITDHYNNRDSFSLLTYIAAKTDRIMLGPGVTNPYTRHPAQLASAIATVNEISGGRAVFGIGPGDRVTFDALDIAWERPLRWMRESVEIVRQLTHGQTVRSEGELFKLRGAKLSFGQGEIPIYIGAQGPGMLRLAGEVADGTLVNASHPGDFETALELLREGRFGHNLDNFDVGAYTSFSVSSDSEEAKRAARPVVAFIVAGSPKSVLEKHEIPDADLKALTEAFGHGIREAARMVTPEMISSFSICGTPEECMNRISELEKAGVTQVVIGSPIGPERKDAIRLVGEEIIPHFQEGNS